MESEKNLFEKLLDRTFEYGKTSYELAKLQTVKKTTDVVSSLIIQVAVLVFIFTFFFFINLGLAYWIGGILDNIFYGFLIVAAFYLMIAMLLHFFLRKSIKKHIRNLLIKQMLN